MIYIHIPFCKSFCTYCGFYSEICHGDDTPEVHKFLSFLIEEIRRRRTSLEEARRSSPHTLYMGGGTPSVLRAEDVKTIVRALGYDDYEEFTIEVNPDDIVGKGEDYVKRLLDLGVNRVSMGLQSMDEGVLKWMNRRHSVDDSVKAYDILRTCGVGNVSLDLIFGISGLDDTVWEKSVRDVIALGPDHISAYQLSIEDESILRQYVEQGKYNEADDELCRRQYDFLCSELRGRGFRHYEISNFALPGREAVHNASYWRRLPYVGLGPGAHSFDGYRRLWNTSSLDWEIQQEILTEKEVREETIMLSLRTSEGISEDLLPDTGVKKRLLAEGALEQSDGRIRIPETHFFVSDDIIADLI